MKNNKTKTVLEKMNRLSKRYGFYRKNEKTLVGFSGGADSVTLLHALYSTLGKDRIAAVHINHMLRGEDADADEAFCRDFCQKREIHKKPGVFLAKNHKIFGFYPKRWGNCLVSLDFWRKKWYSIRVMQKREILRYALP